MQWHHLVLILGTLITYTAAFSVSRAAEDGQNSIKSAVDHLKKLGRIPWMAKGDDAVLILGAKGVGKTTLATLLSNTTLLNSDGDSGHFFFRFNAVTEKQVPVLVRSSSSGAAIYDYLEFDDNGGLMEDLSTTFFLRRISNNAHQVKFVFVTDQASVKNDQTNFVKLARHASSIVKNITKYRESLALVVTKVETEISDDEAKIKAADDKVKDACRQFLIAVKNDLVSKKEDQALVDFVQVFIDDVSRIGLLRQPNKAGSVKDTPLVKSVIRNLDFLVNKKANYVQMSPNDFGGTLSAASKTAVNNYLDESCEALKGDLKLLSDQIVDFYSKKQTETADLFQLYKLSQFGFGNISEIPNELSKNFSDQIISTLNRLGISVPSDILRNISRNVEFVDVLKEVSTYTPKSIPEVLSGLKGSQDYLGNSVKWYKTLIDHHDFLTSIEIYRKIANNEYTQELFEEKVFSGFDKKLVNKAQFQALLKLWEQVKKNDFIEKCDQSSFKVMGQFVRVSDVVKKSCWQSAKSLELLAWDTLYIDENIDKTGEQAVLTLIAPTWNIVGDFEVRLNGQNAEELDSLTAKDGALDDDINGKHGKAGNPGGSAGHFFGIGRTFLNSHRLKIHANGGQGGAGQTGGDGYDGKDVDDPPLNGKDYDDPKSEIWKKAGIELKELGENDVWFAHQTCDLCVDGFKYEHYGMELTDGFKMPGNGGNGGAGALGGRRGEVTIIHSSDAPSFKIVNEAGKSGQDGKGGYGGDKVASKKWFLVDDKSIYTEVPSNLNAWRKKGLCGNIERTEVREWKGPGENGKDAAKAATLPKVVPLYKISSLVAYKNFIREHLKDNVIETLLRDFLKEIEDNPRINDMYVPLDFADELLGLEGQFLALRDELSFVPFFESLNRRTFDYEKNKAPTGDDESMMNYLRSAIYSKLCVLNRNVNQNVVVHLSGYLQSLQKEIEGILAEKDKVTINNNAKAFKESVEAKIEAAKSLIGRDVLPEIDRLTDEMNARVRKLLSENIADQKNATDLIFDKTRQQIELEKTLAMRKALEPLRIFGSLIALTGPHGAALGSVVDGIHTLANHQISSPDNRPGKEVISPLFRTSIDKIKVAYKKSQELLEAQLKASKEKTEKAEQTIPGTKYVKGLYSKLKSVGETIKNRKLLQTGVVADYIRDDISDYVKETKKMMKEDIAAGVGILKEIDVYGEVETIMKIYDISVSEFKQIKDDKEAIKKVSASIASAKENLKLLRFHEDVVRKFMVTSIGGLQDDIAELNLTSKPTLETDVKVWKIQNALKDAKAEFHRLADVTAGDKFLQSVDKLEGGLTFLADVYDRIDSYYDRQQLAQYMANIAYGAVEFNNSDYNAVAAELRLLMKSNLVLQHFAVAINSFKQHYFPFSHLYLDVYRFPSSVELKNPPAVKGKVIEVINRLVEQSDKDRDTIGQYAKYQTNRNDFEFFEWDSRLVKDDTTKLLQGKKVVFNADIVRGVDLDAVRFKTIELKFEFNDTTVQKEFDDKFKNYLVTLVMVGNNYYRCGSRFYYISGSDDVSITYSIEKDAKGKPKQRNEVYEKIAHNNFFLSPYTMWEMEVRSADKTGTLESFSDKDFKLKLVGTGQYLNDFPVDFCNKKNDYYNVDTSLTVV